MCSTPDLSELFYNLTRNIAYKCIVSKRLLGYKFKTSWYFCAHQYTLERLLDYMEYHYLSPPIGITNLPLDSGKGCIRLLVLVWI